MNREMSVLQNRLATQIFANHKFAILRLSIEPVAQTVPAGDCIISCSSRKSDVNYMQKECKLNKRQCILVPNTRPPTDGCILKYTPAHTNREADTQIKDPPGNQLP